MLRDDAGGFNFNGWGGRTSFPRLSIDDARAGYVGGADAWGVCSERLAVTIDSGAGVSVAGEDQIPSDSVSTHPFLVMVEPLVDSSLGLASSVVAVPMEAGLVLFPLVEVRVDTVEEKPASAVVRQWVSVAVGVALRFPSTDGRQQQPPVSTVSNRVGRADGDIHESCCSSWSSHD
ncbi:hypothetical protein Dimus_024719 [Dionaea muscipula]